jgi:hypothetical protein
MAKESIQINRCIAMSLINEIDKTVAILGIGCTVSFLFICGAGIISNENTQPGYTNAMLDHILNKGPMPDISNIPQQPTWVAAFTQIMMIGSLLSMVYIWFRPLVIKNT